jgi:hypothetical protein
MRCGLGQQKGFLGRRRITMPYADPEKRRRYNTLYKQRWRKERAKNLPGVRIFVCPRFPSLAFGQVKFQSGFLITNDKEVVDEVLGHADYMTWIFPLAMDWSLTPTPSLDEDDE